MMGTGTTIDRRAFRAYALDGAALFFQPATGVHVRIARAATRPLRRQAPRVAMFGITNACNLTCGFCSRDVARRSEWTVATAAAALRGLCAAGTLEVAYGGGEPFAFRGFDALVAELDETTALAQHVTTNGTLIDAATWPRFAGRFGQVRISIYEDVAWRGAAEVLAGHGQRWGANVLVDDAALIGLPALLAELAARGCHDASLLSYVGAEPHRQLAAAGAARLAAIIADSPIACRLSVCWGDRVPAPRLLVGDDAADCGAGRDFVSITPDRRVQSCSFQDRGLPGATAEEILAAWRTQQPLLAAPSSRRGCARTLPMAHDAPAPPPIAIWQAFSGNNSGECVLVATFESVARAEAYLAELTPGWVPDGPYSPAWQQIFADESVLSALFDQRYDDPSPRELVAIGRTVIAATGAAEDAFPELRALAWKRGARVAPGGIHVHDGLTLVAAIRCRDDADQARLRAALHDAEHAATIYVHGDVVLVVIAELGGTDAITDACHEVVRLAGDRPLAAELVCESLDDAAIVEAKQRVGHRPPETPRLWASFWRHDGDDARAVQFAQLVADARVTRAGTAVLIDPAPDRKRLAVLAYRQGGSVIALDGTRVSLRGWLWFEPPPPTKGRRAEVPTFDVDRVEPIVRATLAPGSELTVTWPEPGTWQHGPRFAITTDAPVAAMAGLDHVARSLGARLAIAPADLDPVAATLRRLIAAVT